MVSRIAVLIAAVALGAGGAHAAEVLSTADVCGGPICERVKVDPSGKTRIRQLHEGQLVRRCTIPAPLIPSAYRSDARRKLKKLRKRSRPRCRFPKQAKPDFDPEGVGHHKMIGEE